MGIFATGLQEMNTW